MQKRGKRGLSTVIVTLILILVSLVAVGIVWLVVRNIIQTGTEGIGLSQFSLSAKILDVSIDNSSNNVSLTLKRNAGKGELEGISFVFSSNENTEVITKNVSLKELEQMKFIFHLMNTSVSDLISVSIVPLVRQDEKEIVGIALDKYNLGKNKNTQSGQTVCSPASNPCGASVCGNVANGTCGQVSCGTCGTGYNCVGGNCIPISGVLCQSNAYYIDFVNGSDSNNGTCSNSAWKHSPGDINYVGSGTLTPGSIVYFKKGVSYYGQIITISDNVNYTITDWGTGSAVINATGKDSAFSVMHNKIIIDGVDKSLILTGSNINHAAIWNYNDNHGLSGSVFKNLNITSIGDSTSSEGIGIKIGGNSYAYTNYIISNNYISYVYSAGIKISGSGTKNISIYNNVIEKSGDKAGEDTQINLSSNAGEGVQDVAVHNNTIRNGPGNANGINCNNINNEIYDNEIYNNGGQGISLSPNYNTNYNGILKVYRNKIYDNRGYGIIIGSSSNLRYSRVYNNVFYNNSDVTEINFLSGASYNEFFSNTVYHNRTGQGIRVQSTSVNNNIRDNIVWTSSSYVLYDSTGSIIENNNLFYRNSGVDVVVWNGNLYSNIAVYRTASGQGQNSIWSQNPYFVNVIINNFHLQSNSPAINNGISLSSYFSTDKDGVSRPQGSAWDIGAYEYV